MGIKDKILKIPQVQLWRRETTYKNAQKTMKYDDYMFLDMLSVKKCGRHTDFVNPVRFTDKMQWMKIFYRDDTWRICSDKYLVRKYLTDLGYGYLLNEMLGVYDRVDEINPDALPDRFVLKATHGSGFNLICTDKANVNWYWWKKIMNNWLGQNIYYYCREWNYDKPEPRIIIEKFLENEERPEAGINDYKFLCLNGKPEYVIVDTDRYVGHRRNIYSPEWELLDVETDAPNYNGKIDKPAKLDEMLRLAKELSEPFPFVRVDFYLVEDRIYFGELTFLPWGGFVRYKPDSFDIEVGEKIILPEPNYNCHIYNELLETSK